MPYGYGSANRKGPSGPGPGGQGARGQAIQNPGRSTPSRGYQNVHQTGAVTQTPGRKTWSPGVGGTQHIPKTKTVTTGGASPFAYTRPIPKGRTTTGGIRGSKKIRDWIAKNKWKAAFGTLGGLTAGAGYQSLSDINKINQWSKMGYGPGNKVPQSMLKSLTGAYVPNKVFEKLGYGPGSLKGWWGSTVSPTHFQPAQKVITPLAKGLTRASLPLTALSGAFYGGEKLSDYLGPAEGALATTLEGANIQDPMYQQFNRGGIVNLFYGGIV